MNKQELQILLGQETKYSKWYLDIIFNAKAQNREKLKRNHPDYIYYERHHILPASLFPEYKDLKINIWNGILLTAKEHYICHALIWKHYKSLNMKPHVYKMANAFHKMQNKGSKGQQRYTSKLYEKCKIEFKLSEESVLKIKRTKNSKEWKETIGVKSLIKMSETKNSKEWKETIGKEAVLKQKETKNSKEWKETKGKEQKRKELQTKENKKVMYDGKEMTIQEMNSLKADKTRKTKKVMYDGKEMTIQEMNNIKKVKTKMWKSKRFDLYHINNGLIKEDLSAKEVREISSSLQKASKENYLGKKLPSYNMLIAHNKSNIIGYYVVEKPSFESRGIPKPE